MYNEKNYVTADEAVSYIRSSSHIHLSSIASVPQVLAQALKRRADAGEVKDLHFYHFHTEGDAPYSAPEYAGIFFDQGFFVGTNVGANVNASYADYLPAHLYESQAMYCSGALPCDVAMVQVSFPNKEGKVSLGTLVDCSIAAIEVAKLKIAVVNPNVPFAYGDLVDIKVFDYLVYDETPLITKEYVQPSEIDKQIGKLQELECDFHQLSINYATEIDLTGQVCADSIGMRIFSGTGGQLDFVRGAKMSKGGKAVIALASRTNKGMSKIVPVLKHGAGVVTPRPDVQWVVTEYGAVNLYGKSLQERARLLISIAHPDDREMLNRAAFERYGEHYRLYSSRKN